jgi:hypothetical protein
MLDETYTSDWRQQHAERQTSALATAHRACITAADHFARRYLPLLLDLRKQGMGWRMIAIEMNAQGYYSRQGIQWTDQTVRQMFKRLHNSIAAEVFIAHTVFIRWNRQKSN